MYRSISYTLTTTTKQNNSLNDLLKSQCNLYNAALEERIGNWRWGKKSISLWDQFHELVGAKDVIPSLGLYGTRVHRGTLKRLDDAFQSFYRRVARGEIPGFPHFKSYKVWDSVDYCDTRTWKIYRTENQLGNYGYLSLMGIGSIKIHLGHGKKIDKITNGIPVKLTVKRININKWQAIVFYKGIKSSPNCKSNKGVGVDRGITHLAALVDTENKVELIDNERFLSKSELKLKNKQQLYSHYQQNSNRKHKLQSEIKNLHKHISNQRKDLNHKLSYKIVQNYDLIVLEDLKIKNMSKSASGTVENPGKNVAQKSGLNKAILDVNWGQLSALLVYKAEEFDREIIFVNPQNTSRTCNQCKNIAKESRSGIKFKCVKCGHEDHADLNAARNILYEGLKAPVGSCTLQDVKSS